PAAAATRLAASYEQLTGRDFGNAFHRFALWVAAEYPERPATLRTVRTGVRGSIAPLGVHYLRIAGGLRSVRIRFVGRAGKASIVFEHLRQPGLPPLTRRLPATARAQDTTWMIPRGGSSTLIVSNGGTSGTVNYRVVGRDERAPSR